MKKAKDRSKKEREINKNIMAEYEGKYVTYGTEIQLMHSDSGGFLCAKNECSKTEQIGYRIEIEEDYNH